MPAASVGEVYEDEATCSGISLHRGLLEFLITFDEGLTLYVEVTPGDLLEHNKWFQGSRNCNNFFLSNLFTKPSGPFSSSSNKEVQVLCTTNLTFITVLLACLQKSN